MTVAISRIIPPSRGLITLRLDNQGLSAHRGVEERGPEDNGLLGILATIPSRRQIASANASAHPYHLWRTVEQITLTRVYLVLAEECVHDLG